MSKKEEKNYQNVEMKLMFFALKDVVCASGEDDNELEWDQKGE